MWSCSKPLQLAFSTKNGAFLNLLGALSGAALMVFVFFGPYIRDLTLAIFLGEATVYAKSFSESRFRSLKTGMKAADVMRVMGPPLKQTPWGQFPQVWLYTDQRTITDNFWRRWVAVDVNTDKVVLIISDFWDD